MNAPQTLWVVVDKDGVWRTQFRKEEDAKKLSDFCDTEHPDTAPHRVVAYVPQDSGAAYDRGFADGSAIADTKAALAAVPQVASVPREYQKALLMLYYEHNEPDGSPDQPPFPSFDTWVNSWASKLDAAPREPVKAEPDGWMHECKHDADCDAEPGAVISAKSKALWMSLGPHGAKWVEHYTIPLYAAQDDKP